MTGARRGEGKHLIDVVEAPHATAAGEEPRVRTLALAVFVALAACSSREARAPAHDGPRVGGRLVIGVGMEPRNFGLS